MNGPASDELKATPDTRIQDPADRAHQASMLESETGRSLGRENRRVLCLVAVFALFLVIAHFTPLKSWITNIQEWKARVEELGWMAHAAFLMVCAGGVMVGLPRLPLCAGAGLIFGFVEGIVLSLVGSVMGSYGAFLLARAGARHAVLAQTERWPWVKKMLEEPSWLKVFWVRQMMLPGLVLNVLLGVTSVTHSTFLLGTSIGYLPLNIAFTLVGSGLGKGSLAQSLPQLLGAIAVVNALGWLVWKLVRARQA